MYQKIKLSRAINTEIIVLPNFPIVNWTLAIKQSKKTRPGNLESGIFNLVIKSQRNKMRPTVRGDVNTLKLPENVELQREYSKLGITTTITGPI